MEVNSMPAKPIVGLHHITAFVSNPQRNLNFYTEVLGQRFVKRTINFDDPGTYHFYFGDDVGTPGTIMTTFPWPHAAPGVAGVGETTHIAYSVPLGSIDHWQERLTKNGVSVERTGKRFQEEVLTFSDPDGIKLEIVGHTDAAAITSSRFADVPAEHALRGFFGVTLLQHSPLATEKILNMMGFHNVAEEGNRIRFSAPGTALGNHIDLVIDPSASQGHMGAGIIHHIAFRAADDASQLEWRVEIEKHLSVTTVQDRDYFHSIYFREPGGVLFELATDPPGFTLDEPIETLGEALHIPAWLEPRRLQIEQRLLPITLKHSSVTEEKQVPA